MNTRLTTHMSVVHGIDLVGRFNAFEVHADDHDGRLDIESWEHGRTDLYAYIEEDDNDDD